MGRIAQFSKRDFLAAARELAAEGGPAAVTMAAVAAASKAPTGSIYHRFSSRDVLLGSLWLDLVDEFETGFCAALDSDDGLAAAQHTPRWARANPLAARVLLLHHSADFNSDGWPADLQTRAAGQRDRLNKSMLAYSKRHQRSNAKSAMARLSFAAIDMPHAAVRRYIEAREPLPATTERLIETAYRAVMVTES